MESKSFSWLLCQLSTNKCRLNIVDTFLIDDQKPSCLYFKDQHQNINSCSLSSTTLVELLSLIQKDFCGHRPNRNPNDSVCFFIDRTQRRKITGRQLNEIMLGQTSAPLIYYIQPALFNSSLEDTVFIFRLDSAEKGFSTNCWKNVNNETKIESNPEIVDILCDMAMTVVTMIEDRKNLKVIVLELEFIYNDQKQVSISFAKDIKIQNTQSLSVRKDGFNSPPKIIKNEPKLILKTKISHHETKLGLKMKPSTKAPMKQSVLNNSYKGKSINSPSPKGNNPYHTPKIGFSSNSPKNRKIIKSSPFKSPTLESRQKAEIYNEIFKNLGLNAAFRKTNLIKKTETSQKIIQSISQKVIRSFEVESQKIKPDVDKKFFIKPFLKNLSPKLLENSENHCKPSTDSGRYGKVKSSIYNIKSGASSPTASTDSSLRSKHNPKDNTSEHKTRIHNNSPEILIIEDEEEFVCPFRLAKDAV